MLKTDTGRPSGAPPGPLQAGAPAGAPAEAEPLSGSYFVATYPPFSSWSEAAVGAFTGRLAEAVSEPPPLGLYVHLPFCVERCEYCYYLSYAGRLGELDGYLQAVLGEAALYAATPAVAGRPLSFVYFGGGTPSVLSPARIETLLGGLRRLFPWQQVREVSFECAPRTVTRQKVAALRRLGVTRLSLGVQQMDDEVLRASGRIHLTADVERAWEEIRREDFAVVNVDLIVGLSGETEESFFTSLERVLALAPESITLYLLEIPLNTPLYRALEAGTHTAAPPSWEVKRARLGAAFARLEAAGYTVASAYAALREPGRHRFVYQQEQYRGADLLGLGTSAFAYLGGVHQQNQARLDAYLASLRDGRLPLGRAAVLDAEERLVRELVLQLKLGGVSRQAFQARFGVDIGTRFAAPLARYQRAGWLTLEDDAVRLTRAGLLRVDRLLPAFYLPRHRNLRYS